MCDPRSNRKIEDCFHNKQICQCSIIHDKYRLWLEDYDEQLDGGVFSHFEHEFNAFQSLG